MKINFKFLIVLTILLAGCICIGSTFAADPDIAVTDVNIDNTQQNIEIAHDVSSTKNNEPPDNFRNLYDKITSACKDFDQIILDRDYKYDKDIDEGYYPEDGIEIGHNGFTIDGDGHTIDGSGLASIFNIRVTDVTIKNIKLINTASDNGSAIYYNPINELSLTIEGYNITFINCTATNDGGAIYSPLDVTIEGSNITFINCTATNNGGAIYSQDSVTIDDKCSNISFINCTAANDGGAIYSQGSVTISGSNTSFINNSAVNGSGGAISGAVTINGWNASFINNSAVNGSGGAIYSQGGVTISSDNISFIDNTASNKGNAIYSGGSLNIAGCSCNSTDDKAPIYNDGTILSSVVITTIDGETKEVTKGEVVNLTGIITACDMRVAGGVLTLTINGTELNATSDETGLYSKEYTVDFIGTKLVNAIYNNSTKDLQSPVAGYINSRLDVTVIVDNVTGVVGDDKTVSVTVLDSEGNPVTDGVVTILWNGENQTQEVSNGTATFNLALTKAGEYPLTAYYNGSETTSYNDGEGKFTVTVNKMPITVTVDSVKGKVGEKVKVTATVTDEDGNLVPDGEVTFELNGEKYSALIKNGIATTYVTLPDNAGNYTLTAYYAGDDTYQDAYDVAIVEVTAKDIPGPNPDPNPKDVSNPVGNMENTGNPLFVLLVALCAIGLESFRRKF